MAQFGPKSANTFSSAAVPSYYVAGIGRGAVGFTTRSDIGPARPSGAEGTVGATTPASPFATPNFGIAPAGYVAGRGRGMGDLARDQGELPGKPHQEQDIDRGDYSESNYDEFSGYSERLFASGVYDEDDREADQIYDSVDKAMANRNKRRREKQMLQGSKSSTSRPSIAEQFSDLKRELGTVTAEEWDSIPDVGDHTLKYKQQRRKEIYTPTPDYLIESQGKAVSGALFARSIDADSGQATVLPTSLGLAGSRGSTLTSKLDKISDSVTGQTVVDPKGYLTGLNSIKISSDAEIGDIKKARALLQSVTTTNPRHPPGWIAAARVEEFAGNMVAARKIIRQGCDINPESDDLWIEAARLHDKDDAKSILASAVKHIPTSVALWSKAADLEDNINQKKIVLRRALENIPNSVKLWKTAIDLEDVNDARIMLARAVECVPQAVDMWLALAKLETHENARKVLNQAREANPTERATWITAAKLEEAHGNGHLVDRIIEKMMASLTQYQVVIDREQWIREAEDAEHAAAKLTCAAIVKNTIHLGVDDEDRKATWMDDAETCLTRSPPSIETARAIHQVALTTFPTVRELWLSAAVLEKEHGTAESLENILKEGVKHCPREEKLWLMAAKEKWLQNNIPSARAILTEAFAVNPQSEQIWLAAVKLEWENNEFVRARALLAKARTNASSERIWMKSALLEREIGDFNQTLALLDAAIAKYPSFPKYYMIAGQTCVDDLKDLSRGREYYRAGLQACPTSVPLWKLIIYLEEKVHGANKARAMAELARLKLPTNDELMLETIRLERRSGNEKLAESLMAKALQDCPTSGMLWAEDVLTCPKHQQKSKSVDALQRCDNDPHVILAVARLFEKDHKVDKARKWFERVVTLSPRLGDAWAYYYAFELNQQIAKSSKQANESAMQSSALEAILNRCVASDPNRGELWCAITKTTSLRRADIATKLKKVVGQVLAAGQSVKA